jgi:hypothetical protein
MPMLGAYFVDERGSNVPLAMTPELANEWLTVIWPKGSHNGLTEGTGLRYRRGITSDLSDVHGAVIVA